MDEVVVKRNRGRGARQKTLGIEEWESECRGTRRCISRYSER